MDKSNLIDFNNENCVKVSSPLIPAPRSAAPRLSDIENNPFDKVLRTIANKDDPFECNSNISVTNNFNNNLINNENKENIGHLVSPIQTPVKSKKHKKLSTSPLYISKNPIDEIRDLSLNQLPVISEILNLSSDCNVSDISLQILSDSMLNTDDDLYNVAYNLPLPDSSDDVSNCSSNINTDKIHMNIPSLVIQDESKNLIDSYSPSSTFNNAFIGNDDFELLRNRLSTRSSIASKDSFNPNSFNVRSLGTSDISNVLPSVSSITSKDSESDNPFNNAFQKENSEMKNLETRRCLSSRKPSNHFSSISSLVKSRNLNNSFAGFNHCERDLKCEKLKFSDNDDNDSVFLEASILAEVFRTSVCAADSTGVLNDEDISQTSAPWLEEKFIFDDDEPLNKNNENTEHPQIPADTCTTTSENETVLQLKDSNDARNKSNDTVFKLDKKNQENIPDSVKSNEDQQNDESSATDTTEVKNAKELLQNLTAILNSSGSVVDQRKLGESLLNSLALALNIENPASRDNTEHNKSTNKLQRSKSDSKIGERSRTSLTKQENKLTVPKIKTQPAAPAKLDKNLKVRNEKDKVSTKGPLKAVIPVTNMAKNKRSITPKINLPNTTPPKQSAYSLFQIKKTSTPNEPKIKPPIAQSTPEVSKKQGSDMNNVTPKSKRHFGFSISPLSRPASTNDISNSCINNSLSPKNTSGSAPNLNKSGSKQASNSSIPTIKQLNRRNSASDMSTSRSSKLNRSYENNQPAQLPVQLKRSSSFQSKSTGTNNPDNINPVKKYGIPGTLKSLKLVPRAKKPAAD